MIDPHSDPPRRASMRIDHEWARAGPGECYLIVDVLSFTTTLSVAIDGGARVYPYPFGASSAAAFAAARGAVLAVGRPVAGPGQVSLSPASVRAAGRTGDLVLPSPNGSAISFRLAASGAAVVGCSLRNRRAVARWVAATRPASVVVVSAGERWPDGSLRPAGEDLWGAGAAIAALLDSGLGAPSPEASAAVAAFRTVASDLGPALHDCVSGRELVGAGFAGDVEIAAELDASDRVPVLRGECFTGERPPAR